MANYYFKTLGKVVPIVVLFIMASIVVLIALSSIFADDSSGAIFMSSLVALFACVLILSAIRAFTFKLVVEHDRLFQYDLFRKRELRFRAVKEIKLSSRRRRMLVLKFVKDEDVFYLTNIPYIQNVSDLFDELEEKTGLKIKNRNYFYG